jgi:hypothetical protein
MTVQLTRIILVKSDLDPFDRGGGGGVIGAKV